MDTNFESSTMKNSFSLSSLGVSSGTCNNGTPSKPTTVERPYHSLTKKRKDPSRELWRRSWSSAVSNGSTGDDLWPALQQHYDFIMDKQIIETCKEANGELSSSNSTSLQSQSAATSFNRQWSLNQLIGEFQEMCQWLSAIQSDIYSSPENLSNRRLRLSRMSELTSSTPRLEKFVEQSAAILERIPEARDEVSWRVEHLSGKWESVRQQLTPDETGNSGDSEKALDTSHELKCLRRWLHTMEGRLPPPVVKRSWTKHELSRKLREHQVLQRDVECHGRIVNSVLRLCGNEVAVALERRWHLLYLRAIEWQCHLEASIARLDQQSSLQSEQLSESDDEPALKQPRLCRRGSPRHALKNVEKTKRQNVSSNDESNSEEDQEIFYKFKERINYSSLSSETDLDFPESDSVTMESLVSDRHVPGSEEPGLVPEDFMAGGDCVDGVSNGRSQDVSLYEDSSSVKTPPTVIKRRKQHDSSRFNQSDRKSKHLATFYFKHLDTDSDRKALETDEKSIESSEEEWTYVGGEQQDGTTDAEVNLDSADSFINSLNETVREVNAMESRTPDLIRNEHQTKCNEDIERLVMQAEEMVQKKAQQAMKAKQNTRTFKPLLFDEAGKVERCPTKISRIKEWLRQNSNGKNDEKLQCLDCYDASGEYTTESEMDKQSVTSDEMAPSVSTYRQVNSSLEMSSYTVTPGSNNTPVHTKVTLRKKRNQASAPRPWSVSCISQFSAYTNGVTAGPGLDATPVESRVNMSISESALNMMTSSQLETPNTEASSSIKTTVKGNVSSTTTINEACTSCMDAPDTRVCSLRRKKLKLRKRYQAENSIDENKARCNNLNDRIMKSSSFSGQILSDREDKLDRNAVSDPACRKSRFDTSSTSSNESDEGIDKHQLETISSLRRSIERTHISTHESAIIEQNEELSLPIPSFKLGPAGGPVRPRLTLSCERERNILGVHLGNPNELWDLSGEKDSDVDKSGTGGTEGHSSFSEQAWDFYQEKYNSEPYSEAPDSDAARRLLEFGDDYRAFLDSQSDCCSSLSAHPDNDSPRAARKYKKIPLEPKKTRKTISSAERKKSLIDSLERARNNQENELRRRKLASENSKSSKRLSDSCDLLSGRRRHDSNVTSSDINSSFEYQSANKPDILDSVRPKRKSTNSEMSDSPKLPSHSYSSSNRSDDMSHDVRALIRRSAEQLEATEALLSVRQSSPDVLLCTDYTDIISTCRENLFCLENILAGVGQGNNNLLSPTRCREIRAMAARWSSLRSVALRRGGARRLRRDLAALRDSLNEICDGDHGVPLMHSKNEVVRRIEILKDRLSRLLDYKVSLLKLNVSVRRALSELEAEDIDNSLAGQLSDDIEALYKAWDKSHQQASTELLSLEKTLTAWTEWESGLRELQSCLKEDQATLELLEHALKGGIDQTELDSHLKDIANLLTDKKNQKSDKGGSLSDSGISDGDSEAGSTRAKRLNALKHLARTLHHTLAPGSHALRLVAKRMEQAEKELRVLQESCHALVTRTTQQPNKAVDSSEAVFANTKKTTSGDPDGDPADKSGTSKWFWRAFKTSLPFHICLLALICAAYILGRPRCCEGLNSMTGFGFLPHLRHNRGPPPI